MSNTTTTASGGIGFFGLLFIAFLVLKLTHVIDWSWWWVLSPLWLPWAIAFVVMGVIGVVCVALHVIQKALR